MKQFTKHMIQWILIRVFGGLAITTAILVTWFSFTYGFTTLNLF